MLAASMVVVICGSQAPLADAALPDGRAYELATPQDKQAHDALMSLQPDVSLTGDAVGFNILGSVGDGGAFAPGTFQGNSFVATRHSEGWQFHGALAPANLLNHTSGLTPEQFDFTSDMRYSATCAGWAQSSGGAVEGYACALRRPDGSWSRTPVYRPLGGNVSGNTSIYRGASSDLSHVVFSTPDGSVRLVPGDTSANSARGALYEVSDLGGGAPLLRLVNVDNSGNLIGPATGPLLGGAAPGGTGGSGFQAVSDDGNRIFFTATPSGGKATVYGRVDGSITIALSDPSPSECTSCTNTGALQSYVGASADGGKVVFQTTQQLVDTDTDTTSDLYQYDLTATAGHHVLQLSAGGAGDITPGVGANVLGAIRMNEDGSVVYFAAKGVLTTEANGVGQVAVAGGNNLYAYERDPAFAQGRTRFVASVASADSVIWGGNDDARPAQVTPDGRYFVFQSSAQLTDDDQDASVDVYRYDIEGGELLRISIGESGFPGSNNGNTPGADAIVSPVLESSGGANADIGLANRAVSTNGSIVILQTPERLQEDDQNSSASGACVTSGFTPSTGCDVYAWHNGLVSMISDGQDPAGTNSAGMSASGADIFFITRTQLVPQDRDRLRDVYDARVGGGFSEPVSTLCDALAGGCQGAGTGVSTPVQPKTMSLAGDGNVVSGPRKRLALRELGLSQRRKAARTGNVVVSVRTSKAGKVRAVAKGRIGKRTRRVARKSVRVRKAGVTRLKLRLSRVARQRLSRGKALKLSIKVTSPGARPRSMTVRLPGASS